MCKDHKDATGHNWAQRHVKCLSGEHVSFSLFHVAAGTINLVSCPKRSMPFNAEAERQQAAAQRGGAGASGGRSLQVGFSLSLFET